MLQVDSANKHGILLEVVQVLTDLNLIITKAYISSDGCWFMDGKILSFCQICYILFFRMNIKFHVFFLSYEQCSMLLIKMETRLLMKG